MCFCFLSAASSSSHTQQRMFASSSMSVSPRHGSCRAQMMAGRQAGRQAGRHRSERRTHHQQQQQVRCRVVCCVQYSSTHECEVLSVRIDDTHARRSRHEAVLPDPLRPQRAYHLRQLVRLQRHGRARRHRRLGCARCSSRGRRSYRRCRRRGRRSRLRFRRCLLLLRELLSLPCRALDLLVPLEAVRTRARVARVIRHSQ